MAGFEPRGSITGDLTEALTWFKVSGGLLITAGNAVTLNSEGYVANATKSDAILGVAAKTIRGVSTATSTEIPVYCDPNMVYYNDADGDLTNANVGEVFELASASQIDQSDAILNSCNPFILIKRDPDGDADLSKGLFKPYRTQLLSNKRNA